MQPEATKPKNEASGRPVINRGVDRFFLALADVASFVGRFFREALLPPYEFKEIVRQCYEVGFRSLLLISTTGFITGIVFTNQSRPSLPNYSRSGYSNLIPDLPHQHAICG